MQIISRPVYRRDREREKEESFIRLSDQRESPEVDFAPIKYEQIAKATPDEMVGMDCIQSFVTNMTAPDSLEELEARGQWSLPDEIISDSTNEWTVPRWAKAGDVVFFMHAKTARTKLTRLRTELNQNRNKYSDVQYNELMEDIDHHLKIHQQFGGKIFAVGRVCGGLEYDDTDDKLVHWKSKLYAQIDNIVKLTHPMDIEAFRDYITISRGSALTPLFDKSFDKLRKEINRIDPLPAYVMHSSACPIPLRKINRHNWLEVANDYRRSFILESQYRSFYLDYLLSAIGDQKLFYTECRCSRPDINDSFMDYVIRFDGKYLPVEAKLNVDAEPHIERQLSKYVNNSSIILENGKTISGTACHPERVLVADTEYVYMYNSRTNQIEKIYSLDKLWTKDDIIELKQTISRKLH